MGTPKGRGTMALGAPTFRLCVLSSHLSVLGGRLLSVRTRYIGRIHNGTNNRLMARILVIEDEADIRQVLEYNLRQAGHEVEFVRASGRTQALLELTLAGVRWIEHENLISVRRN